jgi:hypothetical protein
MSDAQLNELLVGKPADVSKEIVEINGDSRPLALQVIPLLADRAPLLIRDDALA